MARARNEIPGQIRDRILRGDPSVLEEIDRLLRDDRMPDEPRQHVLCWLDRAMHDGERRAGLTVIGDWRRFFGELGRRDERSRRHRELIRAIHEAAFARTRARWTTGPALSPVELDELITLVRRRAFARNAFEAEVFMAVVFRHENYAAVAVGLSPRYGPISVDGLRVAVSRVRADLRSHFCSYVNGVDFTC